MGMRGWDETSRSSAHAGALESIACGAEGHNGGKVDVNGESDG